MPRQKSSLQSVGFTPIQSHCFKFFSDIMILKYTNVERYFLNEKKNGELRNNTHRTNGIMHKNTKIIGTDDKTRKIIDATGLCWLMLHGIIVSLVNCFRLKFHTNKHYALGKNGKLYEAIFEIKCMIRTDTGKIINLPTSGLTFESPTTTYISIISEYQPSNC